jgi:hypothetical protein
MLVLLFVNLWWRILIVLKMKDNASLQHSWHNGICSIELFPVVINSYQQCHCQSLPPYSNIFSKVESPKGLAPISLANIRLGWKWLILFGTLSRFLWCVINSAVKSFIVAERWQHFLQKICVKMLKKINCHVKTAEIDAKRKSKVTQFCVIVVGPELKIFLRL